MGHRARRRRLRKNRQAEAKRLLTLTGSPMHDPMHFGWVIASQSREMHDLVTLRKDLVSLKDRLIEQDDIAKIAMVLGESKPSSSVQTLHKLLEQKVIGVDFTFGNLLETLRAMVQECQGDLRDLRRKLPTVQKA